MSTPDRKLEITGSPDFAAWQEEQRISLAFTATQGGKLFLIGVQPEGELSVFQRTFEQCTGLTASPDGQTLWMSTPYQLWRLENAVPPGQTTPEGYDRLFVPRLGYTTGAVDAHDIGLPPSIMGDQAPPIFVNTRFSCLAAPSMSHSFRVVWQPSFITSLAPEDRCHLNGLAMRDDRAAYVSAVSTSDVAEGWREARRDGGVIIDVGSHALVARGLSMPHSPRWRDGVLYVLNSGAGEFGTVDVASGKFEPICFCPGYARGLVIQGSFAVIGVSHCRENRTLSGLALDEALEARKMAPRCGVVVVDLRTGEIAHSLTIEGVVDELYDVAVLRGVVRPGALGFATEEIRSTITIEG